MNTSVGKSLRPGVRGNLGNCAQDLFDTRTSVGKPRPIATTEQCARCMYLFVVQLAMLLSKSLCELNQQSLETTFAVVDMLYMRLDISFYL